MAQINQPNTAANPRICFATIYPVKRTPCGKPGPATNEPRYVTCPGCREWLEKKGLLK